MPRPSLSPRAAPYPLSPLTRAAPYHPSRTTMSSSSSTVSNPFAGPDVTLVRDLNIHERVPVKLDHTTASYSA